MTDLTTSGLMNQHSADCLGQVNADFLDRPKFNFNLMNWNLPQRIMHGDYRSNNSPVDGWMKHLKHTEG